MFIYNNCAQVFKQSAAPPPSKHWIMITECNPMEFCFAASSEVYTSLHSLSCPTIHKLVGEGVLILYESTCPHDRRGSCPAQGPSHSRIHRWQTARMWPSPAGVQRPDPVRSHSHSSRKSCPAVLTTLLQQRKKDDELVVYRGNCCMMIEMNYSLMQSKQLSPNIWCEVGTEMVWTWYGDTTYYCSLAMVCSQTLFSCRKARQSPTCWMSLTPLPWPSFCAGPSHSHKRREKRESSVWRHDCSF